MKNADAPAVKREEEEDWGRDMTISASTTKNALEQRSI
jgi:hypothetical protein